MNGNADRDNVESTSTDPLTGAYVRTLLEIRLARELERVRRSDGSCSMHLFDVDCFKSINDAYGRARGDQVLREVAERVTDLVRLGDTLFRYGGDAFALLLPDTGKADAVEVARRVVDAVRVTPFPGTPPLSVSVSLGVASFPEDASEAAGLLRVADRRSWLAKRRGRACVVADDAAPGFARG
jgi:diguanylate cyclase (GGDEF)-like protein